MIKNKSRIAVIKRKKPESWQEKYERHLRRGFTKSNGEKVFGLEKILREFEIEEIKKLHHIFTVKLEKLQLQSPNKNLTTDIQYSASGFSGSPYLSEKLLRALEYNEAISLQQYMITPVKTSATSYVQQPAFINYDQIVIVLAVTEEILAESLNPQCIEFVESNDEILLRNTFTEIEIPMQHSELRSAVARYIHSRNPGEKLLPDQIFEGIQDWIEEYRGDFLKSGRYIVQKRNRAIRDSARQLNNLARQTGFSEDYIVTSQYITRRE